MIYHIVLVKFKPNTNEKQKFQLASAVVGLKDRIPGILSCSWGPNNSPEEKGAGFEEGFVMVFVNAKARDEYLPHPAHQEVSKDFVDPIVESAVVFDLKA